MHVVSPNVPIKDQEGNITLLSLLINQSHDWMSDGAQSVYVIRSVHNIGRISSNLGFKKITPVP